MQKFLRAVLLFAFTMLGTYNILHAQERVIRGTVTDEKGETLPGASVIEKGAKTGVVTNADGQFTINVSSQASTLVISFIGMNTQEISIGNQTTLNIALTVQRNTLNDVVVVGYGTQKRAEITSSIASISANDIKDLPVAGIDQALQGKIAGVTVNSNGGQPGGGISVRVRGITSINGNDPLYVIDGVIQPASRTTISQDQLGGMGGQTTQSGIAGLNPSDVASIDILKDASAQAIYGSQAANGVVLITTKRGQTGEGKVTYEGYSGFQNTPKTLKLMNLSQFAQYNNEVLQQIAMVNNSTFTPIGEYQYPEILGKGSDWQDAIFETGRMQNHQLSFSGGQEKTTYYLSLNYFDQQGTIIGSGYDRYSLRFNLDHQIKPWLKLGLSSGATRNHQRTTLTNGSDAIVSIAAFNSPAAPITTPGGEYASTVSVGGYSFGNAANPVAMAALRDVNSTQSKAFGNAFGEILFTKYLTLKSEVNFDFTNSENMAFQPYVATNGQTILSPSKIYEVRSPSFYWALRNYLNFNQTFGNHSVSAQLGHEAQESQWNNLEASRQNLAMNFASIGAGANEGQTVGGGKGEWAMESYFARAGYTYNDKYSLNLSFRRDGSVSFGPENRIGYFPAASAGWTITNERFAQNIKYLNYLKLRVGAGAVGNSSAGSNNYTTNIRLFATAPFGAGGIPQNVGNPALGWESVITYNGGIDAGLFKDRLQLTFDVYKKTTSDMLMPSELPVFTGIGTEWNDIQAPWVNAGKMTNTGFDIGVTSYNISKPNLIWKTTVAFSRYKNVLNSLNSETAAREAYTEYGNAILLTRSVPGQPVGQFYGFVTDGLFRSMEQLNGANQGLVIAPNGTWLGDIKYKDLTPDGVIDDKDLTFIGDPNPDFTFGITNTLNIKNFDVSVFLQGSYGNDILNYTRRTLEGLNNVYWNQLATVNNRYSALNPNGTLPRYNQWHQQNMRISDRFVEDGSYLRIQNITLGYNLSKSLINKAKMSNARLFITGQNIYTFTKYTGYDPELGAFNNNVFMQNIDLGNYPNPRTFTFGANVTF